MAPPEAPPVKPANDLTARLVAGAIMMAAVAKEPEKAPQKIPTLCRARGSNRQPAAARRKGRVSNGYARRTRHRHARLSHGHRPRAPRRRADPSAVCHNRADRGHSPRRGSPTWRSASVRPTSSSWVRSRCSSWGCRPPASATSPPTAALSSWASHGIDRIEAQRGSPPPGVVFSRQRVAHAAFRLVESESNRRWVSGPLRAKLWGCDSTREAAPLAAKKTSKTDISLDQLLDLRQQTERLSELLKSQLADYLGTLRPLLAPSRVLGKYAGASAASLAKRKPSNSWASDTTRLQPVSAEFGSRKGTSQRTLTPSSNSTPGSTPTKPAGTASPIPVTVTSPVRWVLTYHSEYTWTRCGRSWQTKPSAARMRCAPLWFMLSPSIWCWAATRALRGVLTDLRYSVRPSTPPNSASFR